MRVLLIKPRSSAAHFGLAPFFRTEPLGLEYIAAALGAHGHQVRIVDLCFERQGMARLIKSFRPEIVGVSCVHILDVHATLQLAAEIKQIAPAIFVAVGGHAAASYPKALEQSRSLDAICVGEGESAMPALCNALSQHKPLHDVPSLLLPNGDGRFAATGEAREWLDLDHVLCPDRASVESYRKHYVCLNYMPVWTLETTRGCRHRCNFCSVWQFYKFGLAALVASRFALMPRMVARSSTAPFSQVATITRCSLGWSGTLVGKDGGAEPAANPACTSSSDRTSSPCTSSLCTSRKVRRQAFLQKLQRVFAARRAIRDLANGIQADEGGEMAVAPTANRFDARANRSRFAAVLVNNNFRLDPQGVEVGAQEVHLRLDRSEIVLRAALQNEPCSQGRQAWHLGDIQENIPRQHRRQAGQDFFRPPALALEVNDVGLQEHRAAVAEHRHGGGGESHIRIVLDRNAEPFAVDCRK